VIKIKSNLKLSQKTNIISANLPYLPNFGQYKLPYFVNGGIEGLEFIKYILEYAEEIKPKIVCMNFSSITNPQKILSEIKQSSYNIIHTLFLKCPFGIYTTKLIDKLTKNSNYFYYKENGHYYQYIINIICSNTITPKSDLHKKIKNNLIEFQKSGNKIIENNKEISPLFYDLDITDFKKIYKDL